MIWGRQPFFALVFSIAPECSFCSFAVCAILMANLDGRGHRMAFTKWTLGLFVFRGTRAKHTLRGGVRTLCLRILYLSRDDALADAFKKTLVISHRWPQPRVLKLTHCHLIPPEMRASNVTVFAALVFIILATLTPQYLSMRCIAARDLSQNSRNLCA